MAVDGRPDAQLERALALAFRHLSRRERTCEEMRRHLASRGIEEDAVEATLEELVAQGYLDDVRFARLFVEDKRALEQWGQERIRRELVARGIDREAARSAVEEEAEVAIGDAGQNPGSETDGELHRAEALLRQRFPDGARNRRERERALGVLLRKGYEYEVAIQALARAGSQ